MRDRLYDAGYSTLGIDMRGHGFSGRSNKVEFYSVRNITGDISGIVKREGLKKYVIIGHCYGANIAMQYAAQHPEGLVGLIVINTSFKTVFTDWFRNLKFARKVFIKISEKLPKIGTPGQTDLTKYIGTGDLDLRRILATTKRNTVQSLFLTYNGVLSLNTEQDATRITCPVYIIGGENDTFFPPDTLVKLHEKIKGSKLTIIPNANHILILNNPEEATDDIVSFLKEQKI